jgi:UDP:flavonoid glycosyltransferase YjiC (YdhE family)
MDRWSDRLYNERKKELTELLLELKPTHVLVDIQQATDVVVLRSIDPNLRVTAISVAPPYYLIPGIPVASSIAMPGDIPTINEGHRLARKWINTKTWRQRFRYFWMDDRWLIKRRLRRNNQLHLKSIYDSLLTLALDNVDQLVLTYREFDFVNDKIKGLRYVGAHPDHGNPEPNTGDFEKLVNNVRSKGSRVVYCSFGTVPTKQDIVGFLNKLSKAAIHLNCTVVVSTRLNNNDKSQLEASDSLKIFEWVPQSYMIKNADAFITHGGINSVHDGILNCVPMLVYPIEQNYDQNGNGARVEYLGLGLLGSIERDSPADVQSNLSLLLNDERFRKSLKDFNLKVAHYNIEDVIKLIV